MRFVMLWLIAIPACGRIGYEPRLADDASPDAPGPSPVDSVTASCPTDTGEIPPPTAAVEARVCIELAERGNETWTTARATCEALGRRLCTDAEWARACVGVTGLVDMAGDGNWEWVAEEAGGVAQKRGVGVCEDRSEHEIFVDPYDYRCCVDL